MSAAAGRDCHLTDNLTFISSPTGISSSSLRLHLRYSVLGEAGLMPLQSQNAEILPSGGGACRLGERGNSYIWASG